MSKIPTAAEVLEQQKREHGMSETPNNVPAVADPDGPIDHFLTAHCGGEGATFFQFKKGSMSRATKS